MSKSNCYAFLTYAQCYFLTIAQILGTGVLGLPVTLAESGFTPFLLTFFPTFLVQVLLIVFVTDLLQKAVSVQLSDSEQYTPLVELGGRSEERMPLTQAASDSEVSNNEDGATSSSASSRDEDKKKQEDFRHPDLHYLGELFLHKYLVYPFDIVVLIFAVAILISYALAGGQAWSDLTGFPLVQTLSVFCWVLTILVVFAQVIVMPVVSVFTFFKGSLLLATVVIAFIVGSSIHEHITTDFAYTGRPLLMGTVALGGMTIIMPYMYSKIKHEKNAIKHYRTACILGLLTCCLLNVAWCWAILQVVPQRSSECVSGVGINDTVCIHPNVSLLHSKEEGQISTTPFKEVIEIHYSQYNWVAVLVTLFIVISITVSYVVSSSVLAHTVCGWIESHWPKSGCMECCNVNKYITAQFITEKLISLVFLSVVYAVAMLNPKSFEAMLEKVASLFLNTISGIFFYMMIYKATSPKYVKLTVPLPLSNWVIHLQYFILIYFNVAVIYDLVTWCLEIAHIKHY